MIVLSPVLFWLFVGMGFIYGILAYILTLRYKKIMNPSAEQTKRHNALFSFFFLGFLVFGLTPIFLWLMLLKP